MLGVVHSTKVWIKKAQDHEKLNHRSLFLFTKTNKLRIVLHKVCKSWIFEYFILCSIVTSCVIVVLQGKRDGNETYDPYTIADLVLNLIFGTEAAIKIIAFGFILHRGAYLRNNWNVFDFIVVISGFASDIYSFVADSDKSLSLKALRLFRVVRPLRLIAKSDNLRVVLDTLVKSFGTLMHVLLFIFLLIILYAITGMELFGGALHTACFNKTSLEVLEPVELCQPNDINACTKNNNSVCLDNWAGLDGDMASFDNVYLSIITVIQIITMEDWVFLHYKMNAVASSYVTSAYFVSLILIGGYFAVDLLMGVLGNQYLRTKQCLKRSKEIRKEKKAIEDRLCLSENLTEEPQKTNNPLKQTSSSFLSISKHNINESEMESFLSNIINSKLFFWFIMIIVVIDVVISSVYVHMMKFRDHENYYIYIRAVILMFYVIELSMIALGKGLKKALKNGLFVFNTTIVLISVIEMVVLVVSEKYYIGLSVIRAVTLIQVFKHTRFWSQMLSIIKSFVESIKGVTGIMGLLFIVLANYALLGNQLFGNQDVESAQLGTFDTFGSSLLLSFVLLTGDNWTTFMTENIKRSKDETIRVLTVLYFISFVLLGNFILMNVFLGIIVDNLTSDYEDNADIISSRSIKMKSIGVLKMALRNKPMSEVQRSSKVASCNQYDQVVIKENFKSANEGKKNVYEGAYKTNEGENDTNEGEHDTNEGVHDANKGVQDTNEEIHDTNEGAHDTNEEVHDTNEGVPDTNEGVENHDDVNTENQLIEQHNEPDFLNPRIRVENSLTVNNRKNESIHTMSSFVDKTIKNTTMVRFDAPFETPSKMHRPSIMNRQRKFSLNITTQLPERMRAFSLLLDPDIMHPIPKHNALFLLHHKNALRVTVFDFVTSSNFALLVGSAILLSSLMMAFGDPLERDVDRGLMMQYIDYVFTGIFFGEMVLKSIAYGFIFGHKKCYLREPMNVLDFLVLVISVFNICLTLQSTDRATNKIPLRILRVFRIVRMLKVSDKLKRVINCLINSVQKIFYFLVLYLLILFIYSVIGVQLYRDALSSCSNPKIDDMLKCERANYTWNGNQLTFKNIGSGMTTLFVLSTLDDWFSFLEKLIKVEQISSTVATLYIVSFILIMSFVMLNVFIGFVIVVFHKEKDKNSKCKILDKTAQESIITALTENPSSTYALPHFHMQRQLWKIVTSKYFHTASIFFIVLNTIFLITKTYKQSDKVTAVQHYANISFTVIFTVEIILKFMVFSWNVIIKDSWLIFDTIVVIGSWVDIVLDLLKISSINISLFRLFRVARLAKVVGKGGNLRQLFSTFLKSMKSVPHIACLLALILYLYSIIGMELFGKIRLDSNTAINKDTNFQSFAQSVFVLIRVTTLDAWHEIMIACADVNSMNCQDSNENCGSYMSYFYFASFVFICSYIMTHLFLAVIMDNFVYLTHDISTLDNRHIHKYTALWNRFDKKGIGYISTSDMLQLLKVLDPPLGCGLLSPSRSVYGKVLRLQIPIEENFQVKFTELLMSLVIDSLNLRVSNSLVRDDIQNLVRDVDDDLLDRVLPLKYDPRVFNQTEKIYYRDCASYIIAGYYRMYRSGFQYIKTTQNGDFFKKYYEQTTSIVLNHVTRKKENTKVKVNTILSTLQRKT